MRKKQREMALMDSCLEMTLVPVWAVKLSIDTSHSNRRLNIGKDLAGKHWPYSASLMHSKRINLFPHHR